MSINIDDKEIIAIIRRIQAGTNSQEDTVTLWKETCNYIQKGIVSRSYKSSQDPSMSVQDIYQEVFIRIPSWAMTFPKDMTSWGQWARSCWWRFSVNLAQHHFRHRPYAWVSMDAESETINRHRHHQCVKNIPAKDMHDKRQELYDDIIELMDSRYSVKSDRLRKKIYKYLYERIINNNSIRKSALLVDTKINYETFRKYETQIITLYKIHLKEQL
jgi:hypothetical protein